MMRYNLFIKEFKVIKMDVQDRISSRVMKSAEEARGANRRKTRNLGNNAVRNFSGNNNELWYPGGEKAFLHNYLYQSSLYKDISVWFTSLVSKKETIKSLQKSGEKLKVKTMKIIPMHQGNKVTRIVAWQF